MALVVLSVISGVSFLYYGYEVLVRPRMRDEFARYRLPMVRRFVGTAEMLGGAGVLLGLVYRPLGALAAGGLTVLMVLGLVTRFRLHDAPRAMVPAAVLAVVNAAIVALFLSS